MEEYLLREKLEETLDDQDLEYSLDVDVEEEKITVSVSYRGHDFPRLGAEIDELLDNEDNYTVEFGDFGPETSDTRSQAFTLSPAD